MLSIIICSIKPKMLSNLSINIEQTIGIEHEMISINNAKNKYSLAKAYNMGAKKAKFPNLLFLHEDIAFHTQNWGTFLINLLQQQNIGLVGVSGAVYKSKYPSTWSMIPSEYYRINAIQQWKDGTQTKHILKTKKEASLSEVAVIDGVFMAMRKEVWQQFPFDEENLKGFHFYDMDSSIRIGAQYQIVVSHQILLEHFSEGNISKVWLTESIKWHQRKAKYLPVSSEHLSLPKQRQINYHALSGFCFLLIQNKMYLLGLKYWLRAVLLKPFDITSLNILKLLVKSIVK